MLTFHQDIALKCIFSDTEPQDEDETDEAGGSLEALHGALLPCLSLHLHDVRPHAQARHAKVRVSALCSGLLLFS